MLGMNQTGVILIISLTSLLIQVVQIIRKYLKERFDAKSWEEEMDEDIDEIQQLSKIEVIRRPNLEDNL